MCQSTMQRGRAQPQHDGHVACESGEAILADRQEPRIHNNIKPEKLPWNLSQKKGRNSLVSANLTSGNNTRRVIIKKWNSTVTSKEPRLDPGAADNVFAFISMLHDLPRGLGTRGLERVLSKPDVQGRAQNVLSSLHEECKKKLSCSEEHRGEEESVAGILSCRISRGVSNKALEWSGHKQVPNRCAGNALQALKSADSSTYSYHDEVDTTAPRLFSRWRRRDVQQHPRGRWFRTVLSNLAGVAGFKMLSPKLRWLLPTLANLPWVRNFNVKKGTGNPISRGRQWWQLPVKVVMAVSSRFCDSLSNSLIAAHLLLLVLELRGKREIEGPLLDRTMLQDPAHGSPSCSGRASFHQPGQGYQRANGQMGDEWQCRFCEKCCQNAHKEAIQVNDVDLPWDWKQEIVQLIALTQREGEVDCKTSVPSKERIAHLAKLIHATLSPPTSCSSTPTEDQASAPTEVNAASESEVRKDTAVLAKHGIESWNRDRNSDGPNLLNEVCPKQGHLRHSKSDGSLRCLASRRRSFGASHASVSSLQNLELVTLQNITGESPCCINDCCAPHDLLHGTEAPNERADCTILPREGDPEVSISFVSKDFPEGIELVFSLQADNHDALRTPIPVEAHPTHIDNSALLQSILLEKYKSSFYTPESSIYGSEADDSENFLEACSISLPDLDPSEEQLVCDIEAIQSSTRLFEESEDDDFSMEFQQGHTFESTHDIGENVSVSWPKHHQIENKTNHISSIENCDEQAVSTSNKFERSADTASLSDHIHNVECSESLENTSTGTSIILEEEQVFDEEVACVSSSNSSVLLFVDHPTCISMRKRRHEHGDQNYLSPDQLSVAPWSELVFWHGHCEQGNPTLCILMGKAVQKLPAGELQTISSVIISHMEHAEMNFYKGSAKQMNIIMDLWGLGLMRMPPMEILSRIGTIMNRDYAGRGGFVFIVNAPVMLTLVMGPIKRVILCPAYNKGAMIEKGFLENKERIFILNRNYKHVLEKHFKPTSLPPVFGGKCPSKFCPQNCEAGAPFLTCS